MNEKVEYWIDLADEDVDVAKIMLNNGKYLYCGFMCHQTVEKALKAVIARDCTDDEIPPKIHSLPKLAERASLFASMSEGQKDFIEKLNPMNIEARYPEYKMQLMSLLTNDKCVAILDGTEKLLCWIKKQL
jgi:HEPN domain-containing protein